MSIKHKEPTLDDLIVFKNRLYSWGVVLIVIGIVAIVSCLGLSTYFGIMQTVGLRMTRVLPFLLLTSGIALFACVVSAGVYMVKTSKMITSRLNNYKECKEVSDEQK